MNYDGETSCGHCQCNFPADSSSCSGYYGDRSIRRLTNAYRWPSRFERRQFSGGILIAWQGIIRFGRQFFRSLQKINFRRLVCCGLWIVWRRHRIGCRLNVCCLREGNRSEITQPCQVAAGRVSPVMITGIQQVPGSLVFAAKASIESAKSFTFNLTNSFPSQSE